MAVGNMSGSNNYIYPVKSTDKIYGIGNSYVVSTPINNPEIVIVNDDVENNGSNGTINLVLTNLQTGETTDIAPIAPKATRTISIQTGVSYKITHKNTVNSQNRNFYVYVKQGENNRNTFATVFKSRNTEKLIDEVVKEALNDKYVKYEAIGDFDYIKEAPIETGNVNTTTVYVPYDDSTKTHVEGAPGAEITTVNVKPNEKIVLNGLTVTSGHWDGAKRYSLEGVGRFVAKFPNNMYTTSYKLDDAVGPDYYQ